eukprot:2244024-Rhodomonas_salina.2
MEGERHRLLRRTGCSSGRQGEVQQQLAHNGVKLHGAHARKRGSLPRCNRALKAVPRQRACPDLAEPVHEGLNGLCSQDDTGVAVNEAACLLLLL